MVPGFADANILCGEINGYGSPEGGLPAVGSRSQLSTVSTRCHHSQYWQYRPWEQGELMPGGRW